MRKHFFKLTSLLGIALAVAFLVPQRAAADDDDDPPSRVARLGFTRGAVSFNPAGTDDWVTAVVNRPVTTGDKIWDDADGRAELSIGSAAIRLGNTTGFSFLNLTDNVTQIRVTEGTLNIRVRSLGDDETFEVDTPNLALSILRPGNYKINVNEAGDTTTVIVRDGEGEVTGGGSAYTVRHGEIGAFVGTDQIDADVENWDANSDDDFDAWCADRDRRIDHSVSGRYMSTDAIGYEDMDEYGFWRPVPEYGTVWFPHTAVVGWAPYHYGHWAYIAPWGYTWVDDEPWGFAPFHYGRWITVGGVWGWVPCAPRPVAVVGVAYVRPVYAPALVAWVGGPHFGVGVAVGGNVGWFPLGPREVYVPAYHVSPRYVTNVNVSNTNVTTTVVNNYYNTTVINKNVTNVTYVNQRVPGAVAATTSQAFTSAQPVSRNAVAVNQREIVTAPVAAVTPAVAPARQAVLGSGAAAKVRPPAVLATRAVVAKTAPPPPPVSFAKQQQAIQANGGKPLAISQTRQLQPQVAAEAHPAVKIAPPAKPAVPQNRPTNRPVNQPPNANVNANANANANRPNAPANANPNANRPPNQPTNQPANNTQVNNQNQKSYGDRPPASRPTYGNPVNPQLDQKQVQQQQSLRQQQDQEHQKLQQQQEADRLKLAQQQAQQEAQQKAQQQAQQKAQEQSQQKAQEEARQQQLQQQQQRQQQQLEQKHQQQLDQLEQKHTAQQQQLEQKQQQEREKAAAKPPANNKPPKKEDKPPKKEDKPPHR